MLFMASADRDLTLLQRLAEHLEGLAVELGNLIEEEHKRV
jgi:hypothetical protein